MRIVVALAISIVVASFAPAQEDTTPQKRLRPPAKSTGFVGGESHDSYVIRAEKGQTMSVQISWQHAAGNQAQLTVSESSSFFGAVPAAFGRESGQGKHWIGTVPRTGDYYAYVVAHPAVRYTLRVTLK